MAGHSYLKNSDVSQRQILCLRIYYYNVLISPSKIFVDVSIFQYFLFTNIVSSLKVLFFFCLDTHTHTLG